MKKSLKGLLKLTRFNEYVYFVIITSLLGVATAEASPDWRLFVLLPANWLAVGFAFMINDIEDAPDDVLSTNKINRNPVSAGLISPQTARTSTFIVGVISAGLFAILGLWPFLLGMLSLFFGYIYSCRSVRLKTIAFLDIISHALMLAGLQFLTGYFTFTSRLENNWFWPFAFVLSLSIYGELFNEIRDLEGDRKANLRHTAIYLGEKPTQTIMILMLVIGLFTGAVSIMIVDLIPFWVLVLMALLAALFVLPTLFKIQKDDNSTVIQGAIQKPLEKAAALALLLQFFIPWLDQVLNLNFF